MYAKQNSCFISETENSKRIPTISPPEMGKLPIQKLLDNQIYLMLQPEYQIPNKRSGKSSSSGQVAISKS